jgi:ceramide glucosyltransferase
MTALATGDVFVIADSDMRVDPTYLRSILAPFSDRSVGAVTCLYGGTPRAGIPSALGAMFVNEYFAPSVLVALSLGELSFGFGATIAVRRTVLDAIGGFEALAPHLADDYRLANRVHEQGWRVVLSPYVIENVVAEPSLSALLRHELRWARTIRGVRPLGYALSGVTFPLPFAVLYLLFARNAALGALLIGGAAALRVALHYLAPVALRVNAPRAPSLIPLRDVLAFAVWGASFFGRGVRWRARDFILEADGALHPKERPEATR